MALSSDRVGQKFALTIPDKDTLLQQTYLEAFQANYDSVQRWTKWKDDHEQLKGILTTLPDQLTHDIVIPFGFKALMKARLVHTNEVLTCLGDKWFVSQSCKQALDLCNRRINQSQKMLEILEKEQSLLINRQTLPKIEEAFGSEDAQEIIEEYDEKKEADWRVQHRQREKEFRQKLNRLYDQHENHHPLQSDEDVFRRLDELELEEELNDELERLHAEYEDSVEKGGEECLTTDEESDSEDINSEDEEIFELITPKKNTQKITSQPQDDEHHHVLKSKKRKQVIFEDQNEESMLSSGGADINKLKRLTFADQSLSEYPSASEDVDPNIYIRFRHSKNPSPGDTKYDNILLAMVGEFPEIQNPSDVYNYHIALAKLSRPKSILKKRSFSPEATELKSSSNCAKPFGYTLGLNFPSAEAEDHESSDPYFSRDLSHLPPVLCDVIEKSSASNTSNFKAEAPRPISRFKAARQGSRKQ